MSNPIRYDPLLVRHLAGELDRRLHGRRAAAIRLDPRTRVAALELEGEALVFDLHPARGTVRLGAPPPAELVIALRRKSFVAAVEAPPDERRLEIRLGGTGAGGDRPRALVVELMTNQWNALVPGDGGRILAVLWRRVAGERELRPGAVYRPPEPSARAGVDAPLGEAEWLALLGDAPAGERERRLVGAVAWTSPVNAPAILDAGDLREAHARYRALVAATAARPVVLDTPRGRQPYPFPLPGVRATPCPSLLAAIAYAGGATESEAGAAVDADGAPARPPSATPEQLEALRRMVARAGQKLHRLEEELARSGPEAARLRREGNLILAHLHAISKGAAEVRLPDFDGGTATITLDPALTPAENAERRYRAARKRDRAARSLPPLIDAARAGVERLVALLRGAERGEVDGAALAEALRGTSWQEAAGAGPGRVSVTARRMDVGRAPASLPYRIYRTSGGHEVRVGRSSRANDELTFRHASPDDIWLHARDSAGAHVILRWPHRDANPPARDLEEAATLAALHSRARTSGLVPVDWTRRKYVRKPRKAPPGLVTADRVRTVFVEPDESVEERMRIDGATADVE